MFTILKCNKIDPSYKVLKDSLFKICTMLNIRYFILCLL